MKHTSFTSFLSMLLLIVFLTGCSGMPKLFWDVEDDKPDYARSSGNERASEGRAPLNVPPQLREDVSVPAPDQVAVNAAMGLTEEEKEAIAGKEVSLDARVYEKTPAEVFSAAVDGMTSLNLPVNSVDSPSGTITTEWIRKTSNNAASYFGISTGLFGGGPIAVRYRFIVRVLRMQDGKTQLQIRTLGQQFMNRNWSYKEIKRKVANELFTATEERLGMLAEQAASTPVDTAVEAPASDSPAGNP